MKEIVSFSCRSWKLHGVVHLPEGRTEKRIGVVLVHENINTKFGTHGVFRKLADALAEAGFFVLRFDDRGTCDSEGVCDLTFLDRVADCRSAVTFFRNRYGLDSVVGWGLCLGSSVAVHSSVEAGAARECFEALVLCSVLADSSIVSLPQYGYQNVNLTSVLRGSLLGGNLLRKLREAPRKLDHYRKNLPKLARLIFRRYTEREPALEQLRTQIARVGQLLAEYQGPMLLIFGENDPYWKSFETRINPNDKLGLRLKDHPPSLVLVKNGDHTFSSLEQTQEMINASLAWIAGFRNGRIPELGKSYRRIEDAVSLAPVAD